MKRLRSLKGNFVITAAIFGVAIGAATYNVGYSVWMHPIERIYWDQQGIPENYYGMHSPIPWWMPVEHWLSLPWAQPYEINEWDCSRMAAYTEWALETRGYEAKIVVSQMYGHAWVLVKLDGQWVAYEATGRYLVRQDGSNGMEWMYYWTISEYPQQKFFRYLYASQLQFVAVEFDDIYDVWNWTIAHYPIREAREWAAAWEWAWWIPVDDLEVPQ
jgi:hypothetical protein